MSEWYSGSTCHESTTEQLTVTEEALPQIQERIQARLLGRVRDFQLVIQDHRLVLRGHARTYHAKQVALQVTRESTCLPIGANDIEVM
jgi:hypothetical protein